MERWEILGGLFVCDSADHVVNFVFKKNGRATGNTVTGSN